MMRIMILRHGDAEEVEAAGGKDYQRHLTAKGEESVRRAAEGLKRLDLKPETIWTSPLPRALETAQITAEVLGLEDAVGTVKELEPDADPGVLAGLMQEDLADGASAMLVGHNPDLEQLVQYLISETDQANISLKKGGLAAVEADRPIHQGCGSLVGLWTPKHLAKLTE
jgi:phosphohistidine phosphatase